MSCPEKLLRSDLHRYFEDIRHNLTETTDAILRELCTGSKPPEVGYNPLCSRLFSYKDDGRFLYGPTDFDKRF